MIKKRYILLGLLGVELASIPAAASVLHNVSFEVGPVVAAAQLPTLHPGTSRYLVSSNSPFAVTTTGMIGEVKVSVQQRGEIAERAFGTASQMPGLPHACATVLSAHETIIYRASRRTAAERGDAVEQAVIINVIHDPSFDPIVEFVSDTAAPEAQGC